VFTLPVVDGLSSTYFVSLNLESAGKVVSRNFYWLSTKEETLDWARQEEDASGQYDISTWTPTKDFADYTALNRLPKVNLDVTAQHKRNGDQGSATVTLHNASSTLAFAVRLKINKGSKYRVSRDGETDDEILPVLWEDNYFELLPGETREVTAIFRASEKNPQPSLEVEGWNVRPQAVSMK
jgi:exo-1,4-beta-D-glucosaminidase